MDRWLGWCWVELVIRLVDGLVAGWIGGWVNEWVGWLVGWWDRHCFGCWVCEWGQITQNLPFQ